MLKLYWQMRQFKKNTQNKPLYKPISVSHQEWNVHFSSSLIDVCHSMHQSMIGVLNVQHNALIDKVEMDYEVDKHADYVAAMLLHTYFTQWVNDVKEMHKMTNGGE